jgi:uncharacterized protein involved in exopolysaccharide biosynthesis
VVTYRQPILTLSEEFSTVTGNIDLKNKQKAFLAISQSDQVAYSTYESLAGQLPDEMTFKDFKKRVEVKNEGDAILITASFEDPAISASVANAWANATIQTINSAYGDVQPLPSLQAQLADAEQSYNDAQAALEQFIAENQISDLERQIAESQAVLDILQNAQMEIIQKQLNTPVNLLSEQADQYFQTLTDHSQAVFSEQVRGQLELLAYYTNRQTGLAQLQMQVEALREQLNSGSDSIAGDSGDALAVFWARARTFGVDNLYQVNQSDYGDAHSAGYSGDSDGACYNSGDSVVTSQQVEHIPALDIALTDIVTLRDSQSNYVADLDVLIRQIEVEQEKTDAAIADLSKTLAAGGDYQYYDSLDIENPLYQAGIDSLDQITNLELTSISQERLNGTPLAKQIEQVSANIQSLQAQLEQEQATQRNLTNERDLAEKAYQALRVKETEIKTGAQTSNEVVLASAAVPPLVPDSRGTVTNTLLAGIVGGMLAVVWVFASEWWESRTEEEAVAETQ